MHIDAPLLTKQLAHQRQALVHHVQVGIGPPAPGVAVGYCFEDGLFLLQRLPLVADLHVHGEVSPDIERRVNVDQVNLAAELLQQGRHHQLVIAPDQHVAPVVAVGALAEGVFVEQAGLARFFAVARLVNRLDALERQRGLGQVDGPAVAVFVILALPDQLGLHARERMGVVGSVGGHGELLC